MTYAGLISKYVWLVDTIRRFQPIGLDEIRSRYERKWGAELSERTFHRHRNAIEDIFGISVSYVASQRGYSVESGDGAVGEWILDSLSVGAVFVGAHDLRDRILLENVPSGRNFLEPVLAAMREGRIVELTHENFFRNQPRTFRVEPWFVKLFLQRWYLVGRLEGQEGVRTFGLDRIVSLVQTDRRFSLPPDADPQRLFGDSYGIITSDEDFGVVPVALWVEAHQSKYLESLPLHHSQVCVCRGEGYSIFEMRLCPAFDFRQKLLSMGGTVRVLAPKELHDALRGMAYGADDAPGEYVFKCYTEGNG